MTELQVVQKPIIGMRCLWRDHRGCLFTVGVLETPMEDQGLVECGMYDVNLNFGVRRVLDANSLFHERRLRERRQGQAWIFTP